MNLPGKGSIINQWKDFIGKSYLFYLLEGMKNGILGGGRKKREWILGFFP